MKAVLGRFLGLAAALAAGIALLVLPPKAQPSSALRPAALVWPRARIGTVAAKLADGTLYKPLTFLDASTSVGTAPSPDGRFLRLVLRRDDGSLQLLRRLPAARNPSFGPVTAAGDVLAWAESGSLWTIDTRDPKPARRVAIGIGDVVSAHSEADLTLDAGRLYWVASDPGRVDVVHLRSVALGGGPVRDQVENGAWQLSTWPWLVDGAGTPAGATTLRNPATGRDVRVVGSGRLATTGCDPTWCQVTSYAADGSNQVDLVRPDGTGRRRIPVHAVEPAITDVAPLNRFVVLSQAGPDTNLTHTGPLLVYEIATKEVAELSLDAATAFYAHGVLWWSNGNQDAALWHSLDLRTL